ncbi:MAG TPA: nucleoside hydrolase [Acidimicrobiia bacterium]|nr:nucleoside hydrolase [Acidimicrobiia bacterium]
MRLWIDTDVGTNPDDAVALLCAAGHRDVDLVGVSTVDGDTEWRAEIARTLVDAPVVPGARLAVRDVAASGAEALLGIGPLENVARLLAAGGLPQRIGVMGGVLRPVRHRGAVRDVEHNFGTEPAAARAVIGHAPGLLLCPLDVTVRMRPSAADLEAIVDSAPVLGPMLDDWRARQRAAGVADDEVAVRLHDPLALLALAGEPVVTSEPRPLVVDDDGRVHEDSGRGRAVDVVSDVDALRAMERIVELVAQSNRRGQ